MALPPIIVPPIYPDVPVAIGVPPVPRLLGAVFPEDVGPPADAGGLSGLQEPPKWGIYLNGAPAITSETTDGVEYTRDYRISTAPQEKGAFVSYNKVQDPFEGRISFIQAGSVPERTALLQQIATALASLDTGYSLVMPEFAFTSVNLVRQSLRRSIRSGVSMLVVDVWVEEVRVTGTAAFSNTVNPESQATQNGGTVQAQTPAATQVPQPKFSSPESAAAAGGQVPADPVPQTPSASPTSVQGSLNGGKVLNPVYDDRGDWIGSQDSWKATSVA